MKLTGKTAVITGGNSGIGYATAKLFLSEGAKVIITGRNEKAVKEAVVSLGSNAHGVVSDARKTTDLNNLHQQISALTTKVDILFANAGVFLVAPFEQITEELFDSNVDINFKGTFFTVQKLLSLIPQGGSIVLNSTLVVHVGLEGSTAYSASKGAVLSLNKTLAIELAGRNIRVNSISPGAINTPIMGKTGMDEATLQQFAASVMAKIPLKRFGEAEEIAKAVLFLASSDSSYITGAELIIDGGKGITF